MSNWAIKYYKNLHELILIRLFTYLKQCLDANKYKLHDESIHMDFTSLSDKVLHENKQFDHVKNQDCNRLENYFKTSLYDLNKIKKSDLMPMWKNFHDSNIQYNVNGLY